MSEREGEGGPDVPVALLSEEDLLREFHAAGIKLEGEEAPSPDKSREHPVVVSTRLTLEERARVRAIASLWDTSVSQAVRRMLLPAINAVLREVYHQTAPQPEEPQP